MSGRDGLGRGEQAGSDFATQPDDGCRCEIFDPMTEGGGTDERGCPVHAYEAGRRHERSVYLEERAALEARVVELARQLNTPELHDFSKAVVLEAAHQRARWGSEHDAGKEPQDWFRLLGFFSGKALRSHVAGDVDKALHHCISSAAVLANWHAAVSGAHTAMRPGIDPKPPPRDAALIGKHLGCGGVIVDHQEAGESPGVARGVRRAASKGTRWNGSGRDDPARERREHEGRVTRMVGKHDAWIDSPAREHTRKRRNGD